LENSYELDDGIDDLINGMCYAAAKGGNLAVVQWVLANSFD
jgi:hypothetical protein